MAISGGDGSIILTTKVDTKGLDAAMAKMRQQAKGTGSAFESLSNFIKIQETRLASLRQQYASYVLKNEEGSIAAKKLASDIKNLSTSLTQNQAKLNAASASAVSFGAKAKTAIAGVGASLKVLASYLIGIQTIFAVINFSKQSTEFATQTEASVQRLVDIYGEASQVVGDFIDQNSRAIGMSKSAGASIAATYGNLLSVWADQETNAQLTNNLLNQTAVVASKTGRTTTDVAERIRSGLLGNTEAIEDLGINVNIKTIEITDAFKRIADGRSWEQLNAYEQSQVRTLVILEQSTKKYGTTVADTSAIVRNQYQAAYEDFKNTWGQVLNTVLIPVLKILTQVFTIATKGLQVMAGLSGKTVENSGETSSNIKQQTKEQEKLNKAVKKGLAGFDEINTLTEQSAENTADAGTGTQVSGIGDLGGNYDNSFVDQINADLAAIMGVVGFALAAIGIIMICFGHIGWGIGFLIAGAGIFSVSKAALSGDAKAKKVKNIMNGIIAGISLLALILGIILVATGGSLPLGIGLIIVGAAGLATEVAINWDVITAEVSNFFTNNAGLIVGISLALLVLGIILCCCGIITPLSIGLIAAGAAGLATEVELNRDAIVTSIREFLFENSTLIALISGGLLILGIILICVGILPLGIALIAAGAAGLATIVTLNSNAIVDWIKGVWNKVKQFWNSYIAPVFTLKWWTDLAKTCGNGLIAGFELAVNSIIWLFEGMINFVVGGLNLFLKGVDSVISAVGNIFGQDWSVATIPEANLGRVSIPRLAQGTVVPPNREFMAVLGDNKREPEIVSPLSTMKQAVAEVLAQANIGGGFNGTIEVPVIIDGREIARAVREAEGNMGSQTVFGGFANVY